MNPPPYFPFHAPYGTAPAHNARPKLSDIEDDNRRQQLAISQLRQKLDQAWDQIQEFQAIAERAAAENEAMKQNMAAGQRKLEEERSGKRKLEEEVKGALNENARLRLVAEASDAKRARAEADLLHAKTDCKRQAALVQQVQAELSEAKTAAESLKLQKDYLSTSNKNTTARNTVLLAEVLDLKAKASKVKEEPAVGAKYTKLQAEYDALASENKQLQAKLCKAKAMAKDRAERLAKIAALAQGPTKGM